MGRRGSFPGGKMAGAWSWTLSQECVELYLHPLNTSSWRCAQLNDRENFTFTFYFLYLCFPGQTEETTNACQKSLTSFKIWTLALLSTKHEPYPLGPDVLWKFVIEKLVMFRMPG
jgi:hypothetical protein